MYRKKLRDSTEVQITAAFLNEWFARQETISGKTLSKILGKRDDTERPKSDREVGAAVGNWADGDWAPLDESDMVIQ